MEKSVTIWGIKTMLKSKQESPFAIQIELTKGCNLNCSFCGVSGFQEKPNSNLEFMSFKNSKTDS